MKNHTLSRVTAVLLCVAMMLMVMPVMQIAAATEITSIGVSQAAPFGGYRASDLESRYSFDFGGISPTYSNSTYFLKTTDPEPTAESEWVSLEPDECFEPGVTYAKYFRIHLDDTSTYVFADEATLNIETFDGVKATIGSLNPQDVEFGFIYTDVKGFPADSYRLAVGDTIVTEANAGDILGNGTATYDAATATLTLKNATINKAFADDPTTYAGITALDDLTINLEGTNTIDLSSLDVRESAYGISALGDLTLTGDGALTVTAADAEYYSCAVDAGDTLTMMHGGNWKFTAGAIESYGDASAAIYANYGLVMEPTKVGAVLSLSARSQAVIAYSFEAVDYSVKANTVYGDALADVEYNTFVSNRSSYCEVKLTAEENTVYDLMVGGVDVTDANKGNILGDGTAKYDPATRTLTLNKANLTKAYLYNSTEAAVIYTGKPLTINLVGDNVLDTTGADAYPAGCIWSGIITSESFRLTLTGDGSLTIKAGDLAGQHVNGLFAYGLIDVDMTGSLSVSNAGAKNFYGIWSGDDSVSLKVGGKLTLDGGSSDTSDTTPLVYAKQNISLTTPAGATATIKNGNRSNNESIALYTDDGDISIVNDGTLSITTGDAGYDSIPVYADETLSIVNNGTMTVATGDAGDDAYAILADHGDLYIVNNGTMTVTTGDAADDSDAIEGYEAMRLSGDGELTVTTGDGSYASAIYGPDLLVISGKGTYSFSSGIADNWSAAVSTYDLRIEDDVTVTVNAEKSTADDLNGIEIDGDAIISTSGDVTVTVGKAADDAYGIYAGYGLSLIGSGNVTVTVGKADYAYGLYAGDIIIDNPGNVSASATSGTTQGYGIYAYNTASFAGTNLDNTIYAAGSTQAIYNLPAFDPEFYSVKAAEELEAELEAVGLNTTNFTSFKAIEWTSLVKTVEDAVYGDANEDTSVDMKDVLLIRKFIANLVGDTALSLINADANADTNVDMKDVLLIRKFIANLVPSLGPTT